MEDRDYIDRRLSAANRVPAAAGGSARSEALLDRLGARIMTEPVVDAPPAGLARRKSRLRVAFARRGVLLGTAVGVLAVAGVAAAAVAVWSPTTTIGAGTPGYCQTATNATSDVPFPSGDQAARNWALLLTSMPQEGATLDQLCAGDNVSPVANPYTGAPATIKNSLIVEKAMIVRVAFCVWTRDWLTAEQDGDTAAASSAASEVAGALQWPSAQNPGAQYGGIDQWLHWMATAQQWVHAGDVSDVATMFKWPLTAQLGGACWEYVPPANSDNGTVFNLALRASM